MIGGFEQMVLLAALRLEGGAYAVTIREELEERAGRHVARGALYTVLERLESKGYLSSRMGDPTPQRGGRRKRMVRVTAKGVREAASFYNAVMRASRGVSWEATRVGAGQ